MPSTTFPPNIDIISQPHQDTSPVPVGIGIPKHLNPPPFLICVRFVWTCCSVCLSLHPLSSSTTNPVISRRGENSSQLMLKEAFVTLWSPHLPLALLAARDYGLAFTCPYVILNMIFLHFETFISFCYFVYMIVRLIMCLCILIERPTESIQQSMTDQYHPCALATCFNLVDESYCFKNVSCKLVVGIIC